MKLINADLVVHWEAYDDEHETFPEHSGTIADFLDQMTEEGCPEAVDAVTVVRCRECKYWKTAEGVKLSKRLKCCTYHIRHKYVRCDEDFCSRGERKDGERQ